MYYATLTNYAPWPSIGTTRRRYSTLAKYWDDTQAIFNPSQVSITVRRGISPQLGVDYSTTWYFILAKCRFEVSMLFKRESRETRDQMLNLPLFMASNSWKRAIVWKILISWWLRIVCFFLFFPSSKFTRVRRYVLSCGFFRTVGTAQDTASRILHKTLSLKSPPPKKQKQNNNSNPRPHTERRCYCVYLERTRTLAQECP